MCCQCVANVLPMCCQCGANVLLRVACASCYRAGRQHSTRVRDSLRRWATGQKQQSEASAYVASSDFEQMTAVRGPRPGMHSPRHSILFAEHQKSLSSSLTLPLSVSHTLGKTRVRGLHPKEPTPRLFTRELQHPARTKVLSNMRGLEGGAPLSSQIIVDGARGALGGLPRTLWNGDTSRPPSLFASTGTHYEHGYPCLCWYI
jgi:hypothetical protein